MCCRYVFVTLCLLGSSPKSVSGGVAPVQGGPARDRGRGGSQVLGQDPGGLADGRGRTYHPRQEGHPTQLGSVQRCREPRETCNLAGLPEEVSTKVKRLGGAERGEGKSAWGGPEMGKTAGSGTRQGARLTRWENGAGGT